MSDNKKVGLDAAEFAELAAQPTVILNNSDPIDDAVLLEQFRAKRQDALDIAREDIKAIAE